MIMGISKEKEKKRTYMYMLYFTKITIKCLDSNQNWNIVFSNNLEDITWLLRETKIILSVQNYCMLNSLIRSCTIPFTWTLWNNLLWPEFSLQPPWWHPQEIEMINSQFNDPLKKPLAVHQSSCVLLRTLDFLTCTLRTPVTSTFPPEGWNDTDHSERHLPFLWK